jgi:hypothetical protein
MKARHAIAIGLVCASPALGFAEARAEDPPPEATPLWLSARSMEPPRLDARWAPALPLSLPTSTLLQLPDPTEPVPREIRLSHGAKTAIIVTAIVVGALIVFGFVAVGLPHHHP